MTPIVTASTQQHLRSPLVDQPSQESMTAIGGNLLRAVLVVLSFEIYAQVHGRLPEGESDDGRVGK